MFEGTCVYVGVVIGIVAVSKAAALSLLYSIGSFLGMKWESFHALQMFGGFKYVCIFLLCLIMGFYVSVQKLRQGKIKMAWESFTPQSGESPETPFLLKLLPEEKYKSVFLRDGIWLVPKNHCECTKANKLEVYQLDDYVKKDELASVKERREKEFRAYRRRYPFMIKDAIIAQPNSPLSYPIQGAELMPLHTIVIPGLGFHGASTEGHMVTLRASLGTLNTLADVSEDVVHGRGKNELNISTSQVQLLNHVLEHVTYTSTTYLVNAVDIVSFAIGARVVRFPLTIRQPSIPKLFDPGSDNKISNLVTITTKTFLRYHKLRVLIKSIKQYYPEVKLIVADDSEHPEKIEEDNVEHYIMPFGKGWFAGRNLAISQVTTKYYLWVDDDFQFTEKTRIEKLVDVLEKTNLDVVGGSVNGRTFRFKLFYEEGEDSSCLHMRSGHYHPLEGFPNCVVTNVVVNFFLARTDESRRAGFDPKLQRVAHPEFFMDGLETLLVGSCNDVSIAHQSHTTATDPHFAKVEKNYSKFRANTREKIHLKLTLYHFKYRLKCFTKG